MSNEQVIERMRKEGRKAYHEGADIEDNPLDITWMQRAWRDGWIEAKDEALDDGQAVSTSQ
jgi:hypothetical protein